MTNQSQEKVLELYSQGLNQKFYKFNSNANLGVNPREKVVDSVCTAASFTPEAQENQCLIGAILKSYLSKYISNGAVHSSGSSIDLRADNDGRSFVLTLGPQEGVGINQPGTNGTVIYAGSNNNCVVLEAYDAEFLNFTSGQNGGSFGEFVKTGFKGEAFNRTILASYQDGLKIGTCTASCAGREVAVSVSGNVFDQGWNAACDFEQDYKCQLPKDAMAARFIDTSELDEALVMANEMVNTYVGGQASTLATGLTNTTPEA